MNKLFAAAIFLGLACLAHAGSQDRVGNDRLEVTRSSYTETTDLDVVIASRVTISYAGGSIEAGDMYVRSVVFSGAAPSTITFYDANLFTNATTTRAKVYWPGNQVTPVTVDVSLYFSSAVMYSKQGTAPANINWDYFTPPPQLQKGK